MSDVVTKSVHRERSVYHLGDLTGKRPRQYGTFNKPRCCTYPGCTRNLNMYRRGDRCAAHKQADRRNSGK